MNFSGKSLAIIKGLASAGIVAFAAACADQPARVGDQNGQTLGGGDRGGPGAIRPVKPVQVPVTLDHHRQNGAVGAGQSGGDPDRRAFAELYDARDRAPSDQVFGEGQGAPIETVGGMALPAGDQPGDNQPRNVVLNFSDADIRDVVRMVLGEVRQENFLIDADVRGRVSVETRKPLSRDGALSVLENLVRSSGNSLSKQGQIWVVSPAGQGAAGGVDIVAPGGSGNGQGFQVYPLTFVGAQEMAGILTKVLPKGSVAHVDTARNLVMLRGDGAVFDLARDTVEIFDVDAMKDQSVLLRGLTHVDAGTMAFELDNLYGGTNKGPLAGIVKIVPIERLNAIMVISPQRKYLEDAHQWITRLDRSRDPTGRRLFVYYVQNGKAASLAGTLQGLFPTVASSPAPAAPGPTASTGTDTPDAAPAPQVFAPEGGKSAFSSSAAGLRVMADEVNNALLILATAQEYDVMSDVLRKLDIAPLQVLIEATIIEVALQDDLKFGVQYFLDTGGANLTTDGRAVLTNRLVEAIAPGLPGFAFTLADGFQSRFILEALSNVTDVKVISSPQVMVLDNQSAELQVGDQVPVISQSSQTLFTANSPIVNSVEYKETGVTLQVTPRVNSSGLVTLEISQVVSDVARTTTSNINSPTIRQRRILSTVAVHSGDTVTLGGLIRESEQKGQAGLPGFSQIPLIGGLFGAQTKGGQRTELLVLLTPRVMSDRQEVAEVTANVGQKFRALLELRNSGLNRPLPVTF